MKSIEGAVWLEVAELEACGIAYARVISAKRRNSNGWEFMTDPQDGRKVLVKYSTLKVELKGLVDAKYGKEVADIRVNAWRNSAAVNATDLSVLRSHILPDGSALSEVLVASYAKACAIMRMLQTVTRKDIAAFGYKGAADFHAEVCQVIKSEDVPLPATYTKLKEKVRMFKAEGATVVISKRFGNTNSRKIETEQSAWIISEYAQPNKPDTAKVATKYLAVATAKGWPALTENAIYQHLHRPEVEPLWYIGRHGKEHWKNRFEHIMSNRLPSFRDALWCSDGTKLNYWYQTSGGMEAMLNVYIVTDVYSEAILGYAFGASENFKVQFAAAKMALQRSQHRPLQWLYDGQGSHKKKEQVEFFNRATSLHFAAQPYNPKSKSVESVIGRVQKQVMRDRWFFTGQNVKDSKTLNSRPNSEFVRANTGRLPSLEEVQHYAAQDVEKWNAAAHPKSGVPRIDMYDASVNPQALPLDFLDMVELFWHVSTRPVTYTNKGLTIEIENYRLMYEVYGSDGMPNAEFLRKYTNARFTAKWDPEDYSRVRLYKEDDAGQLRFIASADTKRTYARAAVDLVPGERSEIDHNLALRKAQQAGIRAELEAMRKSSGIDPSTLVEIGYLNPDKDAMNRAESQLMTLGKHPLETDDINLTDCL